MRAHDAQSATPPQAKNPANQPANRDFRQKIIAAAHHRT